MEVNLVRLRQFLGIPLSVVILFILVSITTGFSPQLSAASEFINAPGISSSFGQNTLIRTFMADQEEATVAPVTIDQAAAEAADDTSEVAADTAEQVDEAAVTEEEAADDTSEVAADTAEQVDEAAVTEEEAADDTSEVAADTAEQVDEAAVTEEEAADDTSEVAADTAEQVDEAAVTEEEAAEAPADEDQSVTEAPDENGEAVLTEDQGEIAVAEPQVQVSELNKLLNSIFFDFDKSLIRQNQRVAVDAALKILKENSQFYISISGHTDERGTSKYNIGLSDRRAKTIQNYLVAQGIDPNRIVVFAYGEDFPLKKGHFKSAWRFNRRVDIQLWEAPPIKEQCVKTE
jgi:peptidoglycan-associated lipoprotein